MNKPEYPKQLLLDAIDLYRQGMSTRQVAKIITLSKSYVYHLCRSIARSKADAASLIERKPVVGWRAQRARARKLIEKSLNRKLNRTEHVHHIDGNFTNNALSNLQVLPEALHHSLHSRGPEYAIPRWKRPTRKAYMKAYLKTYKRAI